MILNPFDARSAAWHLFAEIHRPYDVEQLEQRASPPCGRNTCAASMFPSLRTTRLDLTSIHTTDNTAIFELFSDPRVVEYYDLEQMREISEADHIVGLFRSRFESSSGIRWAIRELGNERLIGTIGFNAWNPKMRSGTIGYDLKSSVWGNGYATEAIQSVIRAAFSGQLACGSLHRIQADTVVGNVASEKVLNKCGFREEGIRRDAIYIHGSYRDMKCFGLIAC